MVSVDGPVRETLMATDDARMVTEILMRDWSLGVENMPNFAYDSEAQMADGREGFVYVYRVQRTNEPSTADHRTYRRESFVNVKLSVRLRPVALAWEQEVYRILIANYRLGQNRLGGYTVMELLEDRPVPDLSGWYTVIFKVRLTVHNRPVRAAGFGDTINKQIEESQQQ